MTREWRRKYGEVGVKWQFLCTKDDITYDLTGAGTAVTLNLSGGISYACSIEDAAGGIVSYTNAASDLMAGVYRAYLEVVNDAGLILRSDTFEVEVQDPFSST